MRKLVFCPVEGPPPAPCSSVVLAAVETRGCFPTDQRSSSRGRGRFILVFQGEVHNPYPPHRRALTAHLLRDFQTEALLLRNKQQHQRLAVQHGSRDTIAGTDTFGGKVLWTWKSMHSHKVSSDKLFFFFFFFSASKRSRQLVSGQREQQGKRWTNSDSDVEQRSGTVSLCDVLWQQR